MSWGRGGQQGGDLSSSASVRLCVDKPREWIQTDGIYIQDPPIQREELGNKEPLKV